MPPSQTKNHSEFTLLSAVQHFHRTFALPKTDISSTFLKHDGVHALAGLDISALGELRVAAMETCLMCGQDSTFEKAFSRHDTTFDFLKMFMAGKYSTSSFYSNLDTEACRKAQAGIMPLEEGEVKELYELGKKTNEAIRSLTGKYYSELSMEQVSTLNISKVECIDAVYSIKSHYEHPTNREIDHRTTKAFHAAAVRAGRVKPVPIGTPWWHPNKAVSLKI